MAKLNIEGIKRRIELTHTCDCCGVYTGGCDSCEAALAAVQDREDLVAEVERLRLLCGNAFTFLNSMRIDMADAGDTSDKREWLEKWCESYRRANPKGART